MNKNGMKITIHYSSGRQYSRIIEGNKDYLCEIAKDILESAGDEYCVYFNIEQPQSVNFDNSKEFCIFDMRNIELIEVKYFYEENE